MQAEVVIMPLGLSEQVAGAGRFAAGSVTSIATPAIQYPRGYSVTVQDDKQLRGMTLGQPWTGMHALNPFNMFGDPARRADGGWGGWIYAVDADTGVWKWRLRSNYPVVAGITPTAGGVVFFGDVGGNFYALDAANGEKLFGRQLGGAIGGGVITYTANGAQKVAVAYGFTMLAWPVKIVTAKVAILGLDSASANP